jgi:hypothetical protein
MRLCFVAVCGLIVASGCSPRGGATVRSDFDALYVAWHRESAVIAVSSRTGDYVGLPSYRKIVALGPVAVPYIAEKLSGDSGSDFMLAEAVVEICGWNRSEVADASAQKVRDRVRRRLAAGQTCGT